MTFRIGQCSSCGASYKLPATFEADQARCKNCSGVVNIGKVGEGAPTPPPVPAAKPADVPAKKKRSGPSMKERIQAQRKAEAEAAGTEAPAATPAAKVVAKAKPVATKSVVKKTAGAAKPVAKKSAAGAKAGSGDAKDSSRRSAGGSRRRPEKAKKKKSPVGGILAVVVLLGAVGTAAFLMNQEEVPADDTVNAGDTSAEGADLATNDAADNESGESSSTDASAEASPEEVAAKAEEAKAEKAAAKEAKKAEKALAKAASDKAMHDHTTVDLSTIEDFGPFKTTTADRFAELEGLAVTMMDPEAGAAGNRAKAKLVAAGREAMPVIINALKRLDLADEDQFRSADVSQKALQNICNGTNFGWKYPSQEPEKFHAFDKKVIRLWAQSWEQCIDSDSAWAKLAKLDKVEVTPEVEDDDAMDAMDDF